VDAYLKLAAMRWEQIEHDGGGLFWHAPKGNKTKRLHSVPLSNLVARIMHPVQQTGFVFPGNRGAGKVYDHHEYEDEMRGALEQWADYIARLVQPQGVAVLR
jgi:integrase